MKLTNKIKTMCGYDIYEMTEKECDYYGIFFPTFAVFVKEQDYDTVGHPEMEEDTLAGAEEYCKKYSID